MARISGLAAAVLPVLLAGGCVSNESCCEGKPGVIRHAVLFKFKDGTPPAEVKRIEEAFGGLKAKIPGILDFEWGTNVSLEKLDQGFTHLFLVTFADTQARDDYLPHRAHLDFVGLLKPHLDKALVLDYEARP